MDLNITSNYVLNSSSLIIDKCFNMGCLSLDSCINQCEKYLFSSNKYYIIFLFLFFILLNTKRSDFLIGIERKFYDNKYINRLKFYVPFNILIINFVKYSSLCIIIYELILRFL